MVYHNNKSKILHFTNCGYVKKNSTLVSDLYKAFKQGYRFCKKCNPIRNLYLKQEIEILRYANRNGLYVFMKGNEIFINSSVEQWKIVMARNGKSFSLYHKNKNKYYADEYVPNYHLQNFKCEAHSFIPYLEYVVRHKAYVNGLIQTPDLRKNKSPVKQKASLKKHKRSSSNVQTETSYSPVEIMKRLYNEEYYSQFLQYVKA